MKKLFDFIYGLLLLLGIFAGIYGIVYENTILKWIGAIIVFGMPTVIALIEKVIEN